MVIEANNPNHKLAHELEHNHQMYPRVNITIDGDIVKSKHWG